MSRVTVLTAEAIEKLSNGATVGFAGSGLIEVRIPPTSNADDTTHLLYTADDTSNDRLIIVRNPEGETLLPRELSAQREPALRRMLSFVQRASSMPISLPRGWHQFKHDNTITFFALPSGKGTPRWIVEVKPSGTSDVAFWRITTSDDQEDLQRFQPPTRLHSMATDRWRSNLTASLAALTGASELVSNALNVDLKDSERRTIVQNRSYSAWLPELTPSQREFLEAPTDKSIRLRGPAGSGKTLTMALKAVRAAQESIEGGHDQLRTLFVTHSWSLASEVDATIQDLSEYGPLDSITVLPLVSVAQLILPSAMMADDLKLVGEDSLSGKQLQLAQIEEAIDEFRTGDWITYRSGASSDLRRRIDSTDLTETRGLAWDCLIEFGCVLGADGIFPGYNSEARYLRLPRAPWMMPLSTDGDKRVIFAVYELFWSTLIARKLITPDQLLNDFLNYLETFNWNHRRRSEGYDLIFVDEFHLFNVQERQILRYLSREVEEYPRIFMALDPRQSPWEVFIPEYSSAGLPGPEDELESVRTVDIPSVHRSSPQILDLINHIHLEFPNLDLGGDWDVPLSSGESLSQIGPKPAIHVSEALVDECNQIYATVAKIYSSRQTHGGGIAIAIVDEDRFASYFKVVDDLNASSKFRVATITGRDDTIATRAASRGVTIGPAEYMAGLQFDTVLVAGLPDMAGGVANQSYRRRRFLSLLYLAVSRASRDLRIFVNEDSGGIPELLARAEKKGLVGIFRG